MNLFFDLVIFFLLNSSAFLIILLWRGKVTLFKKISIILLMIFWLTIFYGSFVEPHLLKTTYFVLDLPNYTKKPLRIALLSDIHVGPYLKNQTLAYLVFKLRKLQPDLILIAGDFISYSPKEIQYLKDLNGLAEIAPAFAVLGDHDYLAKKEKGEIVVDLNTAEEVKNILEKNSIHILKNQAYLFGDYFWLVGLDDVRSRQIDIEKALSKTDNRFPKIALTHNPDAILYPFSEEFDLILAGHTHGGQIRLPILKAIGKIPTHLGQKIDKGFFEINGKRIFITSGIGTSRVRARLFNWPEIALLTIY